MDVEKILKRGWDFLKEDSWSSFVVTLILAFIIIRFVFFPGLNFLTGSSLPLVIVESCSMYHHEDGFEKIFRESDVYEEFNISIENTSDWIFQDGFSKGDVIFVVGVDSDEIEVGDVIIFEGGARYPLIHRVVDDGESLSTKGDNYRTNFEQLSSEKDIDRNKVYGKALFRVPAIGWVKLIFFEFGRVPHERGVCR